MATIKSYTDLEQSKKLAEILPLESADCFWDYDEMQKFHRISWFEDGFNKESQLMLNENNVCAWSLAALLDVLPAECECMSLEHINYGNNHKKYFMSYVGGENTDTYDNPIDACVEMVIKLHEMNLL